MKVYVVTAGSYSDYHIAKVFTDKDKAEEYREWLYDSNDVEEYETEDNLEVKKYYRIYITTRVNTDSKQLGPNISVTKGDSIFNGNYNYYNDFGKYFELSICRCVNAQNWNREFYVNKYTKALYDLVAIIKQKIAEGASEDDIETLIRGLGEKDEQ